MQPVFYAQAGSTPTNTNAVLGSHPMVLATPKCSVFYNWAALSPVAFLLSATLQRDTLYGTPLIWAFYCSWECTFTNGLSWLHTVLSLNYSPWLIYVFKTSTTRVTLPSSAASLRYNPGHLWNTASQLLFADSKETLPSGVHLNEAGLFLITDNFSAPANTNGATLVNHSQFFRHHRFFTQMPW